MMSQDYRPEEKGVWLALRDIALIVLRIFRNLWEVAPAMLTIQCLLMFVTAIIPAAIVWMTKVIIERSWPQRARRSSGRRPSFRWP